MAKDLRGLLCTKATTEKLILYHAYKDEFVE
jgi:hypothetical protein